MLECCCLLSSDGREHSFNRIEIQQGSSPAFKKKGGAYGVQISQTVYFLLDYPLRMDHCRPAHWIQIIPSLIKLKKELKRTAGRFEPPKEM